MKGQEIFLMKQFLVHLMFLTGEKVFDQIKSFEVKKVSPGDIISECYVRVLNNHSAKDRSQFISLKGEIIQ